MSEESIASPDFEDPLTARIEKCYSGAIHDVMRAMGLKDFTLPAEIRPVFPERCLAGPVFTVSGRVAPEATDHDTLLAWTGLLSQAKPGHVWIDQPNDDLVAHMGELSAETLLSRGVRGIITDGMARDIDFILKIGFQTWCRGYTPRDIVGYWLPDAFDVPVTIGDVRVEPGDYVCADRDGAVIIPRASAEEIIAQSETAINTENKIRTAILAGMDPQAAYLEYGKF